jgi:glycosyltransferase involved in cell wall biosynthesis
MKIRLLIANAYVGGGTARTTLSTASALAERHDVEIVSLLRRRERPSFPVDDRVRLLPLVDEWSHKRAPAPRGLGGRARQAWLRAGHRGRSVVGHPEDLRTEEWTPYTDLALVRWLRSVRDGVIVGTRPALNLAVARFARPRVVRVAQDHMNLASYRPGLRSAIGRWYPRTDAVVTLTERDAEQYRALLGVDGPRILAIPNGVPDLGGHRTTLERPMVITAGRLVKQKGFDRLLPVWARVATERPGWKLEIYGAGTQERALRRQLSELGLEGRAELMGRTSQLFARMAEASLFVMTSRREGLPMVLLEAMGVGLPVVSYDCPTGPGDVIADGVDGYVVPDGDEDALAARLLELMDDPATRRRMSAAALAKAADYDVRRLAGRWEELFAELAAAKAR